MITWEYCVVRTHVTDWSGRDGPRGIVLRGPNSMDFQSIDDALAGMGELGWECFSVEQSPPPIISFQTITLRFKRPRAAR